MSRRLIIRTCILLAVTTYAQSQYIDFFQNLNSFLQPFGTTKQRHDVTKRPETKHKQTHKQKYDDVIFFENDDKKEHSRYVDFSTSTTKPRRKNKSTTPSHNLHTTNAPDVNNVIKVVNSNKLVNNNRNINSDVPRSINNNNRESYNSNVANNSARKTESYSYNDNNGYNNNYGSNSESTSNRHTTQRPINYNNNVRHTTQRPTAYSNNVRQTTQRPTDYNNNVRQTTQTPTDYNNNVWQTTLRPTAYNNNVRQTTQRPTDYNNNVRQTTQRPTDYYNNGRQTTQRPNDYYNNARPTTSYENDRTTRRSNNRGSQTTKNPLLNRPGVKPAVVDESRPPITNRPVTDRPVYDLPFDTSAYRPANTRPPYETERPRPASNRPYETRPVNTRPPFETERPISSGARPVTSGTRPVTSGASRPVVSGPPSGEATEPEIEIGPDEDEMSETQKRRFYEICEKKCEEYKSSNVKKVVALPLGPHSHGVEVNVSSCAPNNVPLIIGGVVTDIRTFPHMALVGWRYLQRAGYSWKCGGSLVSDQFILTAGHCTYHDKDYDVVSGPPHAVQLGSSYMDGRDATVLQVSLVIRHPKYKLRRSYYDVALIKMTTTVTFSDKISPACLGVPPPVGEPVIATGWGKTEFGGDSSVQLRSVSIPIWDMADCREIWGTSRKLPNGPMENNQVCAGERKGSKDTCQGDSGGPAQVQDGCSWRLVAITSVGRSCGAPETPALYAKIPRAFVASQVFTNAKTSRDGHDQYGNIGNNDRTGSRNGGTGNYNGGSGNYNSGSGNYNSGSGGSNGGTGNYNGGSGNYNSGPGNYNSGTGNNNGGGNDHYANPGSSWNVQNDQNYNNNQRTNYDSRVESSNNWNNNNGNQNVYQQNNPRTTVGYNQNNGQNNYNGQSGYNNEQTQSNGNNENPSDIRNYGTQSYGYNDNGRIRNVYNSDNNYNVNTPWWQ